MLGTVCMMSNVIYSCKFWWWCSKCESHSIPDTVASPMRASFGARTSSVSSCWYSLFACGCVCVCVQKFYNCVCCVCLYISTVWTWPLTGDVLILSASCSICASLSFKYPIPTFVASCIHVYYVDRPCGLLLLDKKLRCSIEERLTSRRLNASHCSKAISTLTASVKRALVGDVFLKSLSHVPYCRFYYYSRLCVLF